MEWDEEGAPDRGWGWELVGGFLQRSPEHGIRRGIWFLIVQGQRLQVGTTAYRTPGPSENPKTNADLVHKRSNLNTQSGGVPCLKDTRVAHFASVGAPACGPRAFHRRGGGAGSARRCGHDRMTALDVGSSRRAARLFPRTGDHRVGREDE